MGSGEKRILEVVSLNEDSFATTCGKVWHNTLFLIRDFILEISGCFIIVLRLWSTSSLRVKSINILKTFSKRKSSAKNMAGYIPAARWIWIFRSAPIYFYNSQILNKINAIFRLSKDLL